MRPGEWSVVYSVLTADADLVARFGAYDEDFEKDAYMARSSSATLPIPPIIEWGPALGGFYAIAPRMHGEHIDGLDETRMRSPFTRIREHVLLSQASEIASSDAELAPRVTSALLEDILADVPDTLLLDRVRGAEFTTAAEARKRYVDYLATRVRAPRTFVTEAVAAREQVASTPPRALPARR